MAAGSKSGFAGFPGLYFRRQLGAICLNQDFQDFRISRIVEAHARGRDSVSRGSGKKMVLRTLVKIPAHFELRRGMNQEKKILERTFNRWSIRSFLSWP
jgi:hypothetical protein